MSISKILSIIWRRKWVIIVSTLMMLALSIVALQFVSPEYEVKTMIRVTTASEDGWRNIDYSERLANTFVKFATVDPILEEWLQALKESDDVFASYQTIADLPEVTVAAVPKSELFTITVADSNPVLVNIFADILVKHSVEYYYGENNTLFEAYQEELGVARNTLRDLQIELRLIGPNPVDRYNLSETDLNRLVTVENRVNALQSYINSHVFENARLQNTFYIVEESAGPIGPLGISPYIIIAFVGMLGVATGLVLTLVFENMDDRIYSPRDIERLVGQSAIGEIPFEKALRLPINLKKQLVSEEHFRQLRVNVLKRIEDAQACSVLVAGVNPREGKSTITAHLARVIAKTGRRVLVIDADIRLPKQHDIFGINNQAGLSSVLAGQEQLKDVIVKHSTGVFVLPAGPLVPDITELLGSKSMKRILQQLSKFFDVILIDGSAFEALADSAELALQVDTVFMVAMQSRLTRKSLNNCLARLDQLDIPVSGLIINNVGYEKVSQYYMKIEPVSEQEAESTSITRLYTPV